MSIHEYKFIVLGAGGVGKSTLTVQYVTGVFIAKYDPTIEDSYRKQVNIDDKTCVLEIIDTAGTEQFAAMRELYIEKGQGFILMFSIIAASTFLELTAIRRQITRIKDTNEVPMILVGNKRDLEGQREVQKSHVLETTEEWKAPYLEITSRSNSEVEQVFSDLVRILIKAEEKKKMFVEPKSPEKKKGCVLV